MKYILNNNNKLACKLKKQLMTGAHQKHKTSTEMAKLACYCVVTKCVTIFKLSS